MEGVEWLSLSHCFRLEAWGFLNICRADLSVVDPDFCGSLGKGFQRLRVWELAAPGAFGFDWGFTLVAELTAPPVFPGVGNHLERF